MRALDTSADIAFYVSIFVIDPFDEYFLAMLVIRVIYNDQIFLFAVDEPIHGNRKNA